MAKRTGRPPHQPTEANRKQVKALAAYGVPQDEIGMVIGISKPTLERHYRDELDRGEVEANAKVAESLFRKATGDGSSRSQRRSSGSRPGPAGRSRRPTPT